MTREQLFRVHRNLQHLDELQVLLCRWEDGFVRRLLSNMADEMRRDIERHVENGDAVKYSQPTRWTLP